MARPIQYSDRTKLTLPTEAKKAEGSKAAPNGEREAALRETVLENIGRSDDLYRVDVCRLWSDNFYRVNVYIESRGRIRLDTSYFVQMVRDGVVSSPPMTRRYHDDALRTLACKAGVDGSP